ncbi:MULTISPECIES: YncE family protein [Providencia]|uniref:YncE family protein n=1 Tax=Providencia TaxID=586 RepID=UPI001C5B39F8|nr:MULTISPECIES: hypothetical protein [Providencia]ELR5152300.1 hypothetical protein [Providencia rettgeri]QXX83329.1 hypothetical protein J6836_02705 [Providencia sp. R33]
MPKDNKNASPYLLLLDIHALSIVQFNKSTHHLMPLIEGLGGTPDGIAVDPDNHLIYWSNMGENFDENDGSINVMRFDGSNSKMLLGKGAIRTPKQLQLDLLNQRLYWCDREGGMVSSCSINGSDLITHIARPRDENDQVDILEQCVGIAIDLKNNWIYWTQKGTPKGNLGRIFRAPLRQKNPQSPESRSDIQLLLANLPEPIDLLLDEEANILYWTDRGAEPDGNSLNCANITLHGLTDHRVISRGFKEAIGLTYDKSAQLMYIADLHGGVYQANITTGEVEKLYQGNSYTGIDQYSG